MLKRVAPAAILAIVAIGIVVFIWVQVKFNPNDIDMHWSGAPLPPCFVDAKNCFGHLLGTDEVGRDILSRLYYGGGVSLGLALVATVMEVVLGTIFGVVSRYGGTAVKFIITRIGDALSCFPPWPFLVVMAFVGTYKAALGALVLVAIVAVLFSPQTARIVATKSARNVAPALLDQGMRDFGRALVLLATADFFEIGIVPPTPSWGAMLSNIQENFFTAWWAAVFPGICIFGALLATEILRRLAKRGLSIAPASPGAQI